MEGVPLTSEHTNDSGDIALSHINLWDVFLLLIYSMKLSPGGNCSLILLYNQTLKYIFQYAHFTGM